MKYYTTLFILLLSNCLYSQSKIQYRLSIGNGRAFNNKQIVYKSNREDTHSFLRKDIPKVFNYKNNIYELLQFGLMIEYTLSKKSCLGIGIMKGRSEGFHTTTIGSGLIPNSKYTEHWAGGPIKLGIEYTYSIILSNNNKKSYSNFQRFKMSLLFGAFYLDNNQYDYSNNSVYITKINNITYDSVINPGYTISTNGFMLSGGIRLSYLSKSKKEVGSITFLYDYGFTNLIEQRQEVYYDFLNEYVKGVQISRGSQFKVYWSKPLDIHKTIKKIYHKF